MTYTAAELNQTGIYAIINLDTGKHYIGSASRSFRRRWNEHKHDLRNDKHHSSLLQRAWNKYTEFRFEFKILEFVPPELCIEREQWWLDLFGSYLKENGYNICPTAGNCLGVKHSEETKQKKRESMLGDKNPMFGVPSPMTGKFLTDEQRSKISLKNKGKKLSEETRKKISESHKGKVLSEECRMKIGLANKGRVRTQETINKLRNSRLGKPIPPEQAAKSSLTQRPQGYSFINKVTLEVCVVNNLSLFCRERSLDTSNMSKVANKKLKSYKGWVIYTS